MIEKVSPCHPDKQCDRIAGAIVDLAYAAEKDPKIAVEVLMGHGTCHAIIETATRLDGKSIEEAVCRIAGNVRLDLCIVPQDEHLAENQSDGFRCGDNGVFRGVPLTDEQKTLSALARAIYKEYPTDGKYVLDEKHHRLVICQSNADADELKRKIHVPDAEVNPLGYWTGGSNVDTGAVNRKLGSDMADSVTGGGLHGKDLSKADVSVNIHAFLKAQRTGGTVELCCAIGDETVDGLPYSEIVDEAREYVRSVGGFEKLAEWGLF